MVASFSLHRWSKSLENSRLLPSQGIPENPQLEGPLRLISCKTGNKSSKENQEQPGFPQVLPLPRPGTCSPSQELGILPGTGGPGPGGIPCVDLQDMERSQRRPRRDMEQRLDPGTRPCSPSAGVGTHPRHGGTGHRGIPHPQDTEGSGGSGVDTRAQSQGHGAAPGPESWAGSNNADQNLED